MSTSTPLFCENCGAANEPQAISCCFCAQTLERSQTVLYDADNGNLLANTLLKERYRILKPVGQGGMGTVYRAQDAALNNRPVAIKELILQDLNGKEKAKAIEAFKHEANLLAGLQHANLPGIFAYFEEHGRWYQVMSFIHGETLEQYLERTNRKKLLPTEVLHISKQLCEVLHYLHSQQPAIIFRDVKPGNIMRTPDGQIYLIDFGVARRFKSGQKKDTTPLGSPGYASPEQFGKAQTTPRSDIYSLGATMHQLLSGHEPDSTPFHFPPLRIIEPAVPAQLATLIEQMLEMDPKKRPESMVIIEQNLQKVSSSTTSMQPFSPATPPKQKSKLASFAQMITFIMLICGLVGGFIGNTVGMNNANAANQVHTFATATAQAHAMATAQKVATLSDPYFPRSTLALVDPLTQPGAWQPQSPSDNGQCQFAGGGFQVQQDSSTYFNNCNEGVIFQNFVVQVDMTIIKGDCGGIILREDAAGLGMYLFEVCTDNSYEFIRYVPTNNDDKSETITYGYLNMLADGVQENTISAVANGNHFALYVNAVRIASFDDNEFDMSTIGTIGFAAIDISNATTVLYQNAIIWAIQ